jgi:hypothetical protein
MQELKNSLMQLAAIILVLITLAISTAAVSQWAASDETTPALSNQNVTQPTPSQTSQAQAALVSDARR